MNKFLSLATLTCLSLLTLNAPAHASLTQEKGKAPKAATQPQSTPIVVNQGIDNWTMQCVYPTTNKPEDVTICTSRQTLSIMNKQNNTPTPFASLLLEKSQKTEQQKAETQANADEAFKLILVTPLGFSLQTPITLTLEHGEKINLAWFACSTQGCLATQTLTPAMTHSLTTNEKAHLVFTRVNHSTLTLNFDLNHIEKIINTMQKNITHNP